MTSAFLKEIGRPVQSFHGRLDPDFSQLTRDRFRRRHFIMDAILEEFRLKPIGISGFGKTG
jgi:hypothetical protein